ncbi:GNAT family N-acetyltransferase [Microbulbifer sp. A4B17]|uniref:GNAT family N-acetyltransferase n=1 Tax=Microbulbifer sp. A4B17 TaxID=359370 RepID=UPI0013009E82|nr:N-acetyltransferase [Microbulbifer sp. A4B17]
MEIRQATDSDLEGIWSLFCAVRSSGELRYSNKISREAFSAQWLNEDLQTYVAEELPHLLGVYKLGVNFPGINSHVATASFLVHTEVRDRGVGRALVQHAISRAQDAGYLQMQFNYVPSDNLPAITLYTELGFSIIETLDKAFTDSSGKLRDAYVLQRFLQ